MNDNLRNLNQQQQETMDGSPSCVRDAAGFINIKFQCGPVQEHGVNGTSIENVLLLLIERVRGFQKGPFSCRENAFAIAKMEEAVHWLEERTKKRVAQGVEGTNQQHADEADEAFAAEMRRTGLAYEVQHTTNPAELEALRAENADLHNVLRDAQAERDALKQRLAERTAVE